jgi:hypothetical protein
VFVIDFKLVGLPEKKISKKKTKKHLSIEHLSNVTFVTEKQ